MPLIEKARFATRLERLAEPQWGPKGQDRIAFEVATNQAPPPGLIGRIALGGELASFLPPLFLRSPLLGVAPHHGLRRGRQQDQAAKGGAQAGRAAGAASAAASASAGLSSHIFAPGGRSPGDPTSWQREKSRVPAGNPTGVGRLGRAGPARGDQLLVILFRFHQRRGAGGGGSADRRRGAAEGPKIDPRRRCPEKSSWQRPCCGQADQGRGEGRPAELRGRPRNRPSQPGRPEGCAGGIRRGL